MRTKTLVALLGLVAASLLVAPSASAQGKPGAPTKPAAPAKPAAPPEPPAPEPPPAPVGPAPLSATLTDGAKADYESGKILFGDGDAAGALVKFKSAHEKSSDPRLLWNMAACEKNLRRYSRALKLVRQYLDTGGDKLTDQDKAEAQELLKVMEPLTAKLKLKVSEPGAEVFIDDELVGTSPIEPVVLDIGSRKVRVKKAEFEEFVRDVPVGGAAEVPLDVSLVKIVHEGRLTVHANKEAAVSIDGRTVGTGTWAGVLASGGHTLRVTQPKMLPYESEVFVQDKSVREMNVTLQPEPSKGLPTWAWIAGGAVVAGALTTAGIFAFQGGDTYEGPRGNLTGVGNSPGGVAELGRGFRFGR